ncbi:MAG: family 10 glycosylhydrolase [Candidatus Marinimicrobia bacterium]|nr:family 10 glycosylhydrolase [Candidatus Neomarinimicrobiota bacterium]
MIFLIALFCLSLIADADVSSFNTDRIGIWVVRYSMINKHEIDNFISFAKENKISDLFVQIRGRGDAYYESDFVRKNVKISPQSFDPLKYACVEAHKNNIKVHAWFNTYILYSNPKRVIYSDHLFKLFPEWTDVDIYGRKDCDLVYSNNKPNNYEGVYLSPTHPEVNRYLFLLIKEIMNNYDIDGIHFDYIRFQGKNWGYNKKGAEIFYKETGINFIQYNFEGNDFLNDSSDYIFENKYSEYRIESVNKLIKRVSDFNKNKKKQIEISTAVKPNPLLAKRYYYQDWLTWIKEDWVDFVVTMNYSKNNDSFNKVLKIIKNNLNEDECKKVMTGIGIWKQSPVSSFDKIVLVNLQNFKGIVLFSYTTLKTNKNYYKKMVEYVRNN